MSDKPTTPLKSSSPLLLVDGFNVLHSVILKGKAREFWWNADHQSRVLELVEKYQGTEECWIIFDAARSTSERMANADFSRIFYAPSADDWIVDFVRGRGTRSVTVVSADRSLLDRARGFGAIRMSPWQFQLLCKY